MIGVFEEWAPVYRTLGLEPRPISPGEKACKVKGWQKSDADFGDAELARWLKTKSEFGIGLRLGTMLPNGRKLGVLDIDRDDTVRLARALLGPTSERIGSKGTGLFFQYVGELKRKALSRADGTGPQQAVGDLLVEGCLSVVPPTIHPTTGRGYLWLANPLHEFDLDALPTLGLPQDFAAGCVENDRSIHLVLAALQSRHLTQLAAGVQTHLAALGYVNELIQYTEDADFILTLVTAALPEGYTGDSLDEVPEMVRSAVQKGIHFRTTTARAEYDHGVEGPIPSGYLSNGDFVLFDQTKRIMVPISSNSLITLGNLLNFASERFWLASFPAFTKEGRPSGVDAKSAGDAIMEICRRRGGFDQGLVRGRGVFLDPRGGVIVNWGGAVPDDTSYFYVCHRPLDIANDGREVDPASVLALFQRFNWVDRSAATLILGWAVSSIVCGVLEWRPHGFLTGAKNTGKTTLVRALQSLLDPIAIVLDGQSTEAGIRQKVGPDSRPVILDEFESDQDTKRMKQIIKYIRSASSADSAIARGTPEGKALEFSARSSFLLAAINPMAVTAADRSRIIVLSLNKHANDRAVAEEIARDIERLRGLGPSWCRLVLGRVDLIRENITTLRRVFPPCDSRHALNIATLLGAAQAVLADHPLTEDEARSVLAEHMPLVEQLADAHEDDDSISCWQALLEYRVRHGGDDCMIGTLLGQVKTDRVGAGRKAHGPTRPGPETELAKYGIRWIDGGIVVANSHRGLSDAFADTIWAVGAWGTALKRLDGACSAKQKRFGPVRSEGTWVPADLIPDANDVPEEF